jgi:hypothetical protein
MIFQDDMYIRRTSDKGWPKYNSIWIIFTQKIRESQMKILQNSPIEVFRDERERLWQDWSKLHKKEFYNFYSSAPTNKIKKNKKGGDGTLDKLMQTYRNLGNLERWNMGGIAVTFSMSWASWDMIVCSNHVSFVIGTSGGFLWKRQ